MAAVALETLAWIVGAQGSARRATILMGAAQALAQSIGGSSILFPDLAVHHEDCERAARRTLGRRSFDTAYREGTALNRDTATGYALGEQPRATAGGPAELTRREQEVADGLTNQAIATRLVISLRTAQGHVEHILAKLGFTSRAQVAAWVAERSRPAHS